MQLLRYRWFAWLACLRMTKEGFASADLLSVVVCGKQLPSGSQQDSPST